VRKHFVLDKALRAIGERKGQFRGGQLKTAVHDLNRRGGGEEEKAVHLVPSYLVRKRGGEKYRKIGAQGEMFLSCDKVSGRENEQMGEGDGGKVGKEPVRKFIALEGGRRV